jgi:hypothetical protein
MPNAPTLAVLPPRADAKECKAALALPRPRVVLNPRLLPVLVEGGGAEVTRPKTGRGGAADRMELMQLATSTMGSHMDSRPTD